MNFWWKLGITAAFLAAYAAGVWHIHDWYDGAKQAKELAAGQEAAHQEMKTSFDIDAGFNEHIAALTELQNNVNRSTEHEAPLPDCRITAGRVSALRQAIAGDTPAR